MAQLYKDGKIIEFVCSEKISKGDIVAVGTKSAVAIKNGDVGDTIPVQLEGVWIVEAKESDIKFGDELYQDSTKNQVTKNKPSSGAVYFGIAVSDAEGGKVKAKINM